MTPNLDSNYDKEKLNAHQYTPEVRASKLSAACIFAIRECMFIFPLINTDY